MPDKTAFRKELERIINCHSLENGSDTPDFILADYLMDCLNAFDTALQKRNKWYGIPSGDENCTAVESPMSPLNEQKD